MTKAATPKTRTPRFKFIGDTVSELRKVVWPTRKETTRLTIIVIVVCVVLGSILFGLDYGFGRLVKDVFL